MQKSIDLYKDFTPVSMQEELYKQMLNDRVIYINDDISEETIDKLVIPILIANKQEKDTPVKDLKPITIYVNSYGGSADACLYAIEVIEKSRIPIHCKVMSMSASAGLYITVACHHRVASKNSVFLLHKGSICVQGNMSEAEDIMEFYKESVGEIFDDLLIRRTNITKSELKKIRRNETYCLGKEALKYGFIDELV